MRTDTNEIYVDLQRKLVTAQLQPGAKLKPTELQGEYGCSSNTIRDVLLRLSKVGLVNFEMQRGFRAKPATPEMRSDVTRFRVLLEQEGLALSMKYGGVKWEAKLSAAYHELSHIETKIEQSKDLLQYMDLWSDAEKNFHETLISGCESPLLRETHSNIYAQFRQQMVSQQRAFGPEYCRSISAEHRAILDAALARDVDACQQAIHDHLKRNL